MPHDTLGSLPLPLVPDSFPGETVTSYAARIDSAIASPKEHHVWTLGELAYREREGVSRRKRANEEALEREVRALCWDLVGSNASQLILLGHPSRIVWHACRVCTSGEVVALHPDHARMVCPLHHVWTGPTVVQGRHIRLSEVPPPGPNHSQPVDKAIVEAAARIRDSGASADLTREALLRAASAVRHERSRVPMPEDLPFAAALIETVIDVDVIRAVSNPRQPYGASYEMVASRMEKAANPLADAGVDHAWLMLRWTAAAARYRWAGEWSPEDPNPVIDPIRPRRADPGGLQPFHAYLDCVRSAERTDEAWWDDHYRQEAYGSRYLCREGHISRRRPGEKWRRDPFACPCSVCSGYVVIAGYNSLADIMPWLALEWDPDVTSGPTPWTVRPYSAETGHWICPTGHHYPAIFANRAFNGTGCIYCRGGRLLPGSNDMAHSHPTLAQMWDPDAGNKKTPQEFKAGNQKLKIGWLCPLGHKFVRRPSDLVRSGGRCTVCVGRVLLPGVNDLATLRPDVAAQWNYEKNGILTPDQVKPGTARKVWWRCPVATSLQSS